MKDRQLRNNIIYLIFDTTNKNSSASTLLPLSFRIIVLPLEESLSYNMVPGRDFILLLQQWEILQQTQLGKVVPGVFKLNFYLTVPEQFLVFHLK